MSEAKGFKSWLTTTDHKRIGLLYFWTAFGFFLIGGSRHWSSGRSWLSPTGTS